MGQPGITNPNSVPHIVIQCLSKCWVHVGGGGAQSPVTIPASQVKGSSLIPRRVEMLGMTP